MPSHVLKSLLWEDQKFFSINCPIRVSVYFTQSHVHNIIFLSFSLFLDDEKCCRKRVHPITKRDKTNKIFSVGQNGARLEKEYLHYNWTSDTKTLYWRRYTSGWRKYWSYLNQYILISFQSRSAYWYFFLLHQCHWPQTVCSHVRINLKQIMLQNICWKDIN